MRNHKADWRQWVTWLQLVCIAVILLPTAAGGGGTPKTPTHPRSVEEIRKTIAGIQSAPAAKGDAADREAALRRLRAHRYLAGLPYAKVVLDDKLNQYALAAARLCEKVGRLDHKPPNPGLPEEEYRIALKGTGSSNLYVGFGEYEADDHGRCLCRRFR